ncbi:MAG TPA: NAD-binding protein, partial [Sphingomonas sp.]|uniref:potassium channel family protein n=1 Tax=Sphingomonas sp. TaxID=28214 RepID=UPI002B52C582
MPTPYATTERVLGSPIRNLVSILVFMAVVVVLSISAYMAAGWSFSDASYMVALTLYTVGYGEVHPINTPYLHTVTMATMVLGCTGMILLTSALVQLFTVMQLRQILGNKGMADRIDKLSGHVIICGYGRIGVMLARELATAGTPLIVLERNTDRLTEAEAAGHLTLAGDATEEGLLVRAGVARARTLATVLPDDAANVFITLSARSLCPEIEIIARG